MIYVFAAIKFIELVLHLNLGENKSYFILPEVVKVEKKGE